MSQGYQLGAKVWQYPEIAQTPGCAHHLCAVKSEVSCVTCPQVLYRPNLLSSQSVKEVFGSLGFCGCSILLGAVGSTQMAGKMSGKLPAQTL